MEKHKYKLDTGLRYTKSFEFSSDEEAWETLRQSIPNAFAALYKEFEVKVPINNCKAYIEAFNKKYTLHQIDENSSFRIDTYWMPVLKGITSHSYSLNKTLEQERL